MPKCIMDTEEMIPFAGADKVLYERIKEIAPEGAWHLIVMTEILDFEVKRLSDSLNAAPSTANRLFNLSIHSRRIATIRALYEEFINTLADFQDVFSRDLETGNATPAMVQLWNFYQQTAASVDRLLKFHATVIKLRFVRDSVEHRIQSLMVDWIHHELICLEGLKKQLNRKSKLELDQLKKRSVQVSLVPPSLHTFFVLFDSMLHLNEGNL